MDVAVVNIDKINRQRLYEVVKPKLFKNSINQKQVQGVEAVLDAWEKHQLSDKRWLAYMLATDYHETGHTMQPIEEFTKGKGMDYGKKLKMGGGHGKRIPYTTPNKLYYGRGLVQLTWYENYQMMGRLLGYDLLNKPELALTMSVAVDIMFEGMLRGHSNFGDFTGACLEQFFNAKTENWIEARTIINGHDRAALIADYGKVWLSGLMAA